MAAPTPTPRGVPSAAALHEGFHSKVTIQTYPNIAFYEKTVQPPGFDGGEPIDQTTQFNVQVRTKWPRTLIDLDPVSCPDVAYNPAVITTILAACNKNDVITVSFRDGSTICFWGYLRSFKPNPTKEGEQPMAAVIFQPTNLDSSGAEQLPVLTTGTGT